MIETILSRAVRRLFAGGAAAGIALPAQAQVEQVAPMQRVEITGSSNNLTATGLQACRTE